MASTAQLTRCFAQGTLRFPESVKLVLGSLEDLFGTALGAELRGWCAENGWALAWASEGAEGRLLDPVVLASTTAAHNLSKADIRQAGEAFAPAWASRNWTALRTRLPGSFQLVPVGATSCEDLERCVGVDGARRCVCYTGGDDSAE